jgi:hypothetical protein
MFPPQYQRVCKCILSHLTLFPGRLHATEDLLPACTKLIIVICSHVNQRMWHLSSASSLVLVLQALSYVADWDIHDQIAKDTLHQTVKKLVAQALACPVNAFNTKVRIQSGRFWQAEFCYLPMIITDMVHAHMVVIQVPAQRVATHVCVGVDVVFHRTLSTWRKHT